MPSAKSKGSKRKLVSKPFIEPLQDQANALGAAYAKSLRLKAKALISGLVMPLPARVSVASDLETLAFIAEHHPEAFAGIPVKT